MTLAVNSSTSTTEYVGAFNGSASAGIGSVDQVIPVSGILSSFSVRLNGPPVFPFIDYRGGARFFTVFKNGQATTVNCSINSSSISTCQDTSNAVAFAAGDTIAIRATVNLCEVRNTFGQWNPTNCPSRTMRWTARFQ